jgi:hypothetical protein
MTGHADQLGDTTDRTDPDLDRDDEGETCARQ